MLGGSSAQRDILLSATTLAGDEQDWRRRDLNHGDVGEVGGGVKELWRRKETRKEVSRAGESAKLTAKGRRKKRNGELEEVWEGGGWG